MINKNALSACLILLSTSSMASELNQSFDLSDMDTKGAIHTIDFNTQSLNHVSVIELKLDLNGEGILTSEKKSVCTYWQGLECTGAYKEILHSELMYEVGISIKCNDNTIYTDRKNYGEFTNELIDNSKSQLTFDVALLKLDSANCESIALNIQNFDDVSTEQVSGNITLKETANITGKNNYLVIE